MKYYIPKNQGLVPLQKGILKTIIEIKQKQNSKEYCRVGNNLLVHCFLDFGIYTCGFVWVFGNKFNVFGSVVILLIWYLELVNFLFFKFLLESYPFWVRKRVRLSIHLLSLKWWLIRLIYKYENDIYANMNWWLQIKKKKRSSKLPKKKPSKQIMKSESCNNYNLLNLCMCMNLIVSRKKQVCICILKKFIDLKLSE